MESPLTAQTARRLRSLLAEPGLAQGGRLPTEQALSARLGVSRPILRKALAILKKEGLIESRRGSGNYACQQDTHTDYPAYGAPETLADLEDCLRFRMVIESAAAAEAAQKRTDSALDEIRRAAHAMKEPTFGEDEVFKTDMAFHLAVARAAGNRYKVITLQYLIPNIRMCLQLGRQLRSVPQSTVSRRVASEHGVVLRAIEDGRAEEAARTMEDHLAAGIERIFGKRSW